MTCGLRVVGEWVGAAMGEVGVATLEVIEPVTDRGARYRIAPATCARAGRDPRQQLELSHPSVSRRHAEFRWSTAGLWVSDLRSRSGTFVNGQRLAAPRLLEAGDQIRLGAVVLRYWPPARASAQPW